MTSQSSLDHISSSKNIIKSQSSTVENSKSSNATSINLLEKDNIKLHKSIAKSKIANKNKSITSKQFDAKFQEFVSDLITLNNNLNNALNNLGHKSKSFYEHQKFLDISQSPFMNIKSTNVTSQSPKVFKSVPDTLHANSFDASSSSTSKSLEKLVTYSLPSKRINEEGNLRKKARVYIYYDCI